MVDNSDENIEKLAGEVLESWDMSTLIEYARAHLVDAYMKDQQLFNEDWASTIAEPRMRKS